MTDPIEIELSRAYTLRISEGEIGSQPAVHFAMQHTAPDGEVTIRGGFRIHRDKVTEVLNALAMFR